MHAYLHAGLHSFSLAYAGSATCICCAMTCICMPGCVSSTALARLPVHVTMLHMRPHDCLLLVTQVAALVDLGGLLSPRVLGLIVHVFILVPVILQIIGVSNAVPTCCRPSTGRAAVVDRG